jgi:hypothetical protein
MRSFGSETGDVVPGAPGSLGSLGLDGCVVAVVPPGSVTSGSGGNVGTVTPGSTGGTVTGGAVTGGTVGGVTIAPVTVNVCGVYANDSPSLTHTGATATGAAGVLLGIENEPLHEPLDATEGWITVVGTVVAVTATDFESVPVQPVPLTFTVVPTGPELGDIVNDDGSPIAFAAPVCTNAHTVTANAIAVTRSARSPVEGTWRISPGNLRPLRSTTIRGHRSLDRPDDRRN